MKQTDRVLQSLKQAIEAETPHVLPRVLQQIQGDENTMTNTINAGVPAVIDFPAAKAKRSRKWLRWAASAAAVLVLALGAAFGYGYYTPETVISFDVNPSIELKVNRMERILAATPLNEDAVAILDGMNLKNTDLNVGVNAIIGSMVKNGYISEIKNSILISVDSSDLQKGTALQERLSQEVDLLLNSYSVKGAVLSQTVPEDERLKELAERHSISLGKAALVELLVGQDATLNYEEVAALPINDINLLIAAKQPALEGVSASGQASSGTYIGEENAKQIAFQHAGVSADAVTALKVKIDYDDGRMVYEIEFYSGNTEYDYELDALTGEILEYDRDTKTRREASPPAASGSAISMERAKEIALSDAGLSASEVQIIKQVSYEKQGRWVYDIMFLSATTKYSYLINAATGNVEARYLNDLHHSGESSLHTENSHSGSSQQPAGQYIGSEKAKSIALAHAGASADSVYKYDSELDEDDGRMIYEIEFVAGGMEYECEIDAVTGEILWWDAERD